MSELQEYLRHGLRVLKEKGAVSVVLSGTAHSFPAIIEHIEGASQQREDWTPSDDEECYLHIEKADEEAVGVDPKRGQSFYHAATGLYYEIIEAKRKGPFLTSRYRCRIVREVTS